MTRRARGAGSHNLGLRGGVPLEDVEHEARRIREVKPGDLEARVGRGRDALEAQHRLVEAGEAGHVGGLARDVVELQRRHGWWEEWNGEWRPARCLEGGQRGAHAWS